MRRWIWIGVDLGQRRDYTAIAVLERVRLGTPYPDVVASRFAEALQVVGGREWDCATAMRASGGRSY